MTRILLSFLLSAAAMGCGGGGTGGIVGGGLSAGFQPDFEPDPVATSDTVSMAEIGSSGDMVTVGVEVTNTDNVRSAGFDIVLEGSDGSELDFVGHSSSGTLLDTGRGDACQATMQLNKILVACAAGAGVDAVGIENLIKLSFRMREATAVRVSFENMVVQDGNFDPIPVANRAGGTLQAQ